MDSQIKIWDLKVRADGNVREQGVAWGIGPKEQDFEECFWKFSPKIPSSQLQSSRRWHRGRAGRWGTMNHATFQCRDSL